MFSINFSEKHKTFNFQGIVLQADNKPLSPRTMFFFEKNNYTLKRSKENSIEIHSTGNNGITSERVKKFLAAKQIATTVDADGNREFTNIILNKKDNELQDKQINMNEGSHLNLISPHTGLNDLHLAVSLGKKEVVTDICKHGANLNIKSRDGLTALHYAVYSNKMDIAEILLNYGADANLKNNQGISSKDMAKYLGLINFTLLFASCNTTQNKPAASNKFI